MGLGSIAIGDFSLNKVEVPSIKERVLLHKGKNSATGKGSFASGIESNANGDSSSAIGEINVTANAFGETVVGAYNEVIQLLILYQYPKIKRLV